MPAANALRRAELADAAISLLAERGAHGLTHRNVETRAGLPAGTASNYFRTREALFLAAGQRIVAEQYAEMAAREPATTAARSRTMTRSQTRRQTTELLTDAVVNAATRHRERHRALLELRIEAIRRPAVAQVLDELASGVAEFTRDHHARLGLAIPPDRVPILMALYAGVVWHALELRAEEVTADAIRPFVAAVVVGVLGSAAGENR